VFEEEVLTNIFRFKKDEASEHRILHSKELNHSLRVISCCYENEIYDRKTGWVCG
jgi:hypothetical protein